MIVKEPLIELTAIWLSVEEVDQLPGDSYRSDEVLSVERVVVI